MGIILKIVAVVASLYVLVALGAFLIQRKLMYFPVRERTAPSSLGLAGVSERVLDTPDGERLIAWHAPARVGMPTLLYFHGNGGGLQHRVERVRQFVAAGYGILLMSYRGYSGSTGSPTERANVADAKLAYDWIVSAGVSPGELLLYGESLGSGVAVQVAAARPVAGVILEAPYTSVVDVAVLTYPYLPVRPLLLDRYETMRTIGQVHVPVLVLHGARDDVIPVEMGRRVFESANEPKQLVIFPDAAHSDLFLYGAFDRVHRWVRSTIGSGATRPARAAAQ